MGKIKEEYIVDENGDKRAVILGLEEYQELLEDIHDLAVIADRRDESTTRFDDVKKRLRQNGLL